MKGFDWIKQAIARCKALTPKVFRRVQYIAGAIGAVMVAVNTEFANYDMALPHWWQAVTPYAIGFSTGLMALSQFTLRYDSNGNPVYKDSDYEAEEN